MRYEFFSPIQHLLFNTDHSVNQSVAKDIENSQEFLGLTIQKSY